MPEIKLLKFFFMLNLMNKKTATSPPPPYSNSEQVEFVKVQKTIFYWIKCCSSFLKQILLVSLFGNI